MSLKRLCSIFAAGAAAVVVTLTLVSCGGGESPRRVTLQDIEANYANHFSLMFDREDVTDAESVAFPWSNDEFVLTTNALPTVKLSPYKHTSDDGRIVTVEKEYVVSGELGTIKPTIRMKLSGFNKEVERAVTVNIRLVVQDQNVSGDAGDKVLARAGGKHDILLRVSDPEGDDGFSCGSSVFQLQDLPECMTEALVSDAVEQPPKNEAAAVIAAIKEARKDFGEQSEWCWKENYSARTIRDCHGVITLAYYNVLARELYRRGIDPFAALDKKTPYAYYDNGFFELPVEVVAIDGIALGFVERD